MKPPRNPGPLSFDDDAAPAPPQNPDAPRVVFPSPYRLTADQEGALIDHAFDRYDKIASEMGRHHTGPTGGVEWWASGSRDTVNAGAKSHLGKRQTYGMTYENEVDWRSSVQEGSIFEESNWTVPIARRVVTQQVARANAHFFGSDPWFAADLRGQGDAETRDAAQRWLRHKFGDSEVRHRLEAAVEQAFIQGECVVKASHRRRDDVFEAEMEVLVDSGTGAPVIDSAGDYVTRDRRILELVEENPADAVERAIPGATPPPEPERYLALADDPEVRVPKSHHWETKIVPRRLEVENSIDLENCYFRDILVPLTARDLQIADMVAHLYDIPVAELADQWRRDAVGIEAGDAARNIDTANAVAAIRAMGANTGEGATGEANVSGALHRAERSEDLVAGDGDAGGHPDSAHARIVEFWMLHDANGDGILENILLVADRETRTPIYYDYVANVTPDAKRPFHCIRINPVAGRWYGVGSMQIYEHIQNICDLLVNRWNVSSGSAGRATFVRPEAVVGGETDPDFEINFGELYQLNDGFTAEQALSYVTLPEVKAVDLKNLLDFYLQLALNMSGVQHANDAQMAGLQSAKLATSILNIDKAGHEMFGQILSHLESGVMSSANALAELAMVNMAEEEEYSWDEDDETHYGVLPRARVGAARVRVKLILAKYKAEQEKASLVEVITVSERFYLLPPPTQARLAPLFRQYLRSHDVESVETIIEPVDGMADEPPQAPGMTPAGDPRGEIDGPAPPSTNEARAGAGIAGGLAAVERRAG